MAKFKIKKKIVMVAQVPKTEAPTEPDGQILALQALQVSPGWQIVRKVLSDNIMFLEDGILNRRDPKTMEAITDEQVQQFRVRRNILVELRDTPEHYIKMLTSPEVPADDDNDPYFRSFKEMEAAQAL